MEGKNTEFTRVELLLAHLELNQNEFSAMTGIGKSTVNQYATGERPVSAKAALKIHKRFPNVNIDWLLTGAGEMLLPPGKKPLPMDAEEIALLNYAMNEQRQRKPYQNVYLYLYAGNAPTMISAPQKAENGLGQAFEEIKKSKPYGTITIMGQGDYNFHVGYSE